MRLVEVAQINAADPHVANEIVQKTIEFLTKTFVQPRPSMGTPNTWILDEKEQHVIILNVFRETPPDGEEAFIVRMQASIGISEEEMTEHEVLAHLRIQLGKLMDTLKKMNDFVESYVTSHNEKIAAEIAAEQTAANIEETQGTA